ncbi:glucosaminidase domain-containing protein [Desulfurispira natronophila]|uniref:Bax protein n=1 Tax=Desulfurispira natronophila TaxID=682562 RepID=A0A7W7Y2E9_9BACT|nr:glucosaminidase domain-containing protein [Desulfurispira natronophila]MBB5020833.1 Bax protein [Desulfurispira natronophila]
MRPESRSTWLALAGITAVATALLFGFLFAFSPPQEPLEQASTEMKVETDSEVEAEQKLPTDTYQLEVVDFATLQEAVDPFSCTVPPLTVDDVPSSLADMTVIPERKEAFYQLLLPAILKMNHDISLLREHIKSGSIPDEVYERFSLDPEVGDQELLLKRANTIPPSLVVAMAAIESAWGTSRFALEANNIFGHWTYVPGTGIVPSQRPEGATYEIRIFESVKDSVRAYYHNLNTNRAYREFRQARNETMDPLTLSQYLFRYSQLGDEYGQRLNGIINFNNLQEFDICSIDFESP